MKTIMITTAVALGVATLPGVAAAQTVEGIKSDTGQIGCDLFSSVDGFPMGTGKARVLWRPAEQSGVSCRFDNVAPGDYAVAVSHDLNGNRKTDTNFIGIPREAWGVSNGVRPSMRAPRFAEARFKVANAPVKIDVKVAR